MMKKIVSRLNECAAKKCDSCRYKGKEDCRKLLCDEMAGELRKVAEEWKES